KPKKLPHRRPGRRLRCAQLVRAGSGAPRNATRQTCNYLLLSFECDSTKRLVMISRPKICVHSETMLPTTWPHFELGMECANRSTQITPVPSRNTLSECSSKNSRKGLK